MKITEFDIKLCRENVLNQIDCQEGNDVYLSVVEEYEDMLAEAYGKMEPVALLSFGSLEGFRIRGEEKEFEEALFCITSVGKRISQWSTGFFEQGDYLKGMLADAMADDYLFQMDHMLAETVIELCKERKRGVYRRLEAPQDISMEVQKKALQVTEGEKQAGIQITDSMMYYPVKTTCQVYVLNENTGHFQIEHDCSGCANTSCKMRSFPVRIKILEQGVCREIEGNSRQTLLSCLQKNDVFLQAVCGGKGTCGKCKIQVIEGETTISTEDRLFFGEEELAKGYRLACHTRPKSDCVIKITGNGQENFAIVTDYEVQPTVSSGTQKEYGIAVDIGTTTIAMQLIDGITGAVEDTYTSMNAQRAYGADVISRIESANAGNGTKLRESIRQNLLEGIQVLTKEGNIQIVKMSIGANTTMIHLLMGYSCETLGVYPFIPVNIETIYTTYGELFGKEERGFDVIIYPGISTYVGGDIVSGLLALDFDKREKVSLLIDLGTNGEMAIGNKEKILVASTAAGPAFEGGNIVCGTGSIPGAICGIHIEKDIVHVETIQNQPACGICGTGVVDAVYELLKEEWMDETGLLDEAYFEDGIELAKGAGEHSIRFYQKDVRELQLAKSAIRAGLETLVKRYGVSWEQIEQIFIAGGFGYWIDVKKAISIGLLPAVCDKRITAVGNTCLKGAGLYLQNDDVDMRIASIRKNASEIQLSNDKDFNEFYMEYMYFECD